MFDFLSLPTSFLFAMVIEGLWALVLLYLWRLLKDGPYLLFFALQSASLFVFHLIATFELADPLRSEERRVGKECRSRWWRDH